MSKEYEKSGVSLERGYESVKRISSLISRTKNKGVMGDFGSFGGMFDLSKYNIKEPVLVSGTDGVGTKLLIAEAMDKHDTIGIDLVAMCVNDIVTLGAIPLYFLDYIATGVINPDTIEDIVKGITEGCIQAGCALIGGETAEMPDVYAQNTYDLAGFVSGVVEKEKIINKANVEVGDIVIGLPSSGLHSNGYSLVRKILFKDHSYQVEDYIEELGDTLGNTLLEPTKIYVKPLLNILQKTVVHSVAHITGGGFYENIPRAIPSYLGVEIDQDSLPILPIYSFLEKVGKLYKDEMYHVFNMGIGMVIIIPKSEQIKVLSSLKKDGIHAHVIGRITPHKGVVIK